MDHIISIPIGDWSGDGHSRCNYHYFKTNKPIKKVREAYISAMNSRPDLSPENFCSDYGEGSISLKDFTLVTAEFPSLKKLCYDFEGDFCHVDEEFMVDLTLAFIGLGDPEIKFEGLPEAPMLHFFGYKTINGKPRQHIGGFGYGLFE